MKIILNDESRGYIRYTVPDEAKTQDAFNEMASKCRTKAKAEFRDYPELALQLEKELEVMQKTKCVYTLEILETIAEEAHSKGYPFFLYGNESASLVLYLLNATPARPKDNPYALISSKIFVEELKYRTALIPTVAIAKSLKETIEKKLSHYFKEFSTGKGREEKVCLLFSSEIEKACKLADETGTELFETNIFSESLLKLVYSQVYHDVFGYGLFDHNATGNFFDVLNVYAYGVCALKSDKSFALYLDLKDYFCTDDFFEELLKKGCTESEAYEIAVKGLRRLEKETYKKRIEELGVSPHFLHEKAFEAKHVAVYFLLKTKLTNIEISDLTGFNSASLAPLNTFFLEFKRNEKDTKKRIDEIKKHFNEQEEKE